jgi:hypothetical protein
MERRFMSKLIESDIKNLIYSFRGHRVMLDSDLANIYGVETRVLNQAVSRNKDRFPPDFAFRLSSSEWENLISQNVISSSGHGGRRKMPYVFTEQGVSMLSSVLNSKQAIRANVQIMRTFVSIRNLASTYKELEKRILEVEEKSDKNYKLLLSAMLQLKEHIEPSLKKDRKKIGLS